MAVSSSDLVQRARDIVEDRPFQDSSTTTGTGTSIAVADSTLYSIGHIVEWQTGAVGFEQMYVTAIPNGTTLTVLRGYGGTTAETHTAGDAIVSNPTWTGRNIQQAITAIVNDSWPQIWKPGTINLTYVNTTKWYDLNSLTQGIVSVTQKKNTTVVDFGRFKDKYWSDGKTYVVQRDLPASIVTSTNGIHFPDGVFDTSGTNAIVVRDVRAITGTTDIEDTAQLPMAEAIVWGAAGRLLRAKEIQRVTAGTVGTTRGTTSTGVRYSLGKEYEQEWRARLERLKYELYNLYDPDDVWGH